MTDDVREAALRLLAVRAHSEHELRRKLRQRGHEQDAVDGAVAWLRERGYLDDAAFAAAVARLRGARRSRAAVLAELAAKGVERHVAEGAVASLDRDGELANARRLAATWPSLAPERVAGRLQRRGFPADVVSTVLDERRRRL